MAAASQSMASTIMSKSVVTVMKDSLSVLLDGVLGAEGVKAGALAECHSALTPAAKIERLAGREEVHCARG